MRVGYRARQLWRTISAEPIASEQLDEVRAILSDDEYELFLRYDMADRQHCYRVMRLLHDSGARDHDLLVAALLHDVGKTQVSLTSLDRILGTIVERGWSGRLEQWGGEPPTGWHRPFSVRVQHAEWGAQMAEAAGCSPTTVYLIRHHQDKLLGGDSPENAVNKDAQLLRQLQWADEQD